MASFMPEAIMFYAKGKPQHELPFCFTPISSRSGFPEVSQSGVPAALQKAAKIIHTVTDNFIADAMVCQPLLENQS